MRSTAVRPITAVGGEDEGGLITVLQRELRQFPAAGEIAADVAEDPFDHILGVVLAGILLHEAGENEFRRSGRPRRRVFLFGFLCGDRSRCGNGAEAQTEREVLGEIAAGDNGRCGIIHDGIPLSPRLSATGGKTRPQ